MIRAETINTTDSSRRRFLTVAGAASAVSAASLAAAAMPVRDVCTLDDSELLSLEEQIFELHQAAIAYDPEIERLADVWQDENRRLAEEMPDGSYREPRERWKLVEAMPECIECERLQELRQALNNKRDVLLERLFSMPAHTPEGRRAKVTVLLGLLLNDDWRRTDDETEYPEQMARKLLIEFVGGEPGKMLADQFA
jgi:hypothetical protein